MNVQDQIAKLQERIRQLEERQNAVPLRVAQGGGGGGGRVFITATSVAGLPTPDGKKFARIEDGGSQTGRILSPNAGLTGWEGLNYLGS